MAFCLLVGWSQAASCQLHWSKRWPCSTIGWSRGHNLRGLAGSFLGTAVRQLYFLQYVFNVHIHTILNSFFILKLFEKDYDILNPSWDWFQNTSLHSQILEKIDEPTSHWFSNSTLNCGTLFSPDFYRMIFQTVEVIPNRPKSVTGYLFDWWCLRWRQDRAGGWGEDDASIQLRSCPVGSSDQWLGSVGYNL